MLYAFRMLYIFCYKLSNNTCLFAKYKLNKKQLIHCRIDNNQCRSSFDLKHKIEVKDKIIIKNKQKNSHT